MLLESALAELGTGSREGSGIRDIVELVCKKETEGIRREKIKDRGKEMKKSKELSIITIMTSKSKSHIDPKPYFQE